MRLVTWVFNVSLMSYIGTGWPAAVGVPPVTLTSRLVPKAASSVEPTMAEDDSRVAVNVKGPAPPPPPPSPPPPSPPPEPQVFDATETRYTPPIRLLLSSIPPHKSPVQPPNVI